MKLAIITPVGPGHEELAEKAKQSVEAAKQNPGPWTSIQHVLVDDTDGVLGSPLARNIGATQSWDADWYFYLDADDRMAPDALGLNEFGYDATFGGIQIDDNPNPTDHHPVTPENLIEVGPIGSLVMGCYARGDMVRNNPWVEVIGPDDWIWFMEVFYRKGYTFVKRREPLAHLNKHNPAGGPNGHTKAYDWGASCKSISDLYRVSPRNSGAKMPDMATRNHVKVFTR